MKVEVECYSGYKADESPRSFRLGRSTCQVTEILDRWYEPGATYFRVAASDGGIYILRHGEPDQWDLTSYRRDL